MNRKLSILITVLIISIYSGAQPLVATTSAAATIALARPTRSSGKARLHQWSVLKDRCTYKIDDYLQLTTYLPLTYELRVTHELPAPCRPARTDLLHLDNSSKNFSSALIAAKADRFRSAFDHIISLSSAAVYGIVTQVGDTRYIGLEFTDVLAEHGGWNFIKGSGLPRFFSFNAYTVLYKALPGLKEQELTKCFAITDKRNHQLASCSVDSNLTLVLQSLNNTFNGKNICRYTCNRIEGTKEHVSEAEAAIALSDVKGDSPNRYLLEDLLIIKDSILQGDKTVAGPGDAIIYDLIRGKKYNLFIKNRGRKAVLTMAGAFTPGTIKQYFGNRDIKLSTPLQKDAVNNSSQAYKLTVKPGTWSLQTEDQSGFVVPPIVMLYLSKQLKSY